MSENQDLKRKLQWIEDEKHGIEIELRQLKSNEDVRIGDLESKFDVLSKDYHKSVQDKKQIGMTEKELRNENLTLKIARDSYKKQLFKLKDANKMLKQKFNILEKEIGGYLES